MDIHLQHTPADGDFYLMKLNRLSMRADSPAFITAHEQVTELCKHYNLRRVPARSGIALTYPVWCRGDNFGDMILKLLSIEQGAPDVDKVNR